MEETLYSVESKLVPIRILVGLRSTFWTHNTSFYVNFYYSRHCKSLSRKVISRICQLLTLIIYFFLSFHWNVLFLSKSNVYYPFKFSFLFFSESFPWSFSIRCISCFVAFKINWLLVLKLI